MSRPVMTEARRQHIHGPVQPMVEWSPRPSLWRQAREVIAWGGGLTGLAIGTALVASPFIAATFLIIAFTGA